MPGRARISAAEKAAAKEARDAAIIAARAKLAEQSKQDEADRARKEKEDRDAIPLEQAKGQVLYERAKEVGLSLPFGEFNKLTAFGIDPAVQLAVEDSVRKRIIAAKESKVTK